MDFFPTNCGSLSTFGSVLHQRKCFLRYLPTALLHFAGFDWQTKLKEGTDESEAVLSFLTTKQMSVVV